MAHTIVQSPLVFSSTTAPEIIAAYAAHYGTEAAPLIGTLNCETQGFVNRQSHVINPDGPGGHENSWGVAQIDLDYHPDITQAEAMNPFFAINWAAQQFANGNQNEWTCYRDGQYKKFELSGDGG